ncbi:hypothetical protein [Paraburkholderia heleia]|uniref:hypothetical protein n=1 Tax=Paraburkholderia heleia TaxID=634127 RepID=UPI0012ECCEEC|nr:hypothetical protein [Paraburkholderia heleia]
MTFRARQYARGGRMAQICDWLASFALLLLPVFFTLFCCVLFCVWYFSVTSAWLVVVTALLILCMGLTAGIFGVASAALPVDMEVIAVREIPIFGIPLTPRSVGKEATAASQDDPRCDRTCQQTSLRVSPSCVHCHCREECPVWKPLKLDGE